MILNTPQVSLVTDMMSDSHKTFFVVVNLDWINA